MSPTWEKLFRDFEPSCPQAYRASCRSMTDFLDCDGLSLDLPAVLAWLARECTWNTLQNVLIQLTHLSPLVRFLAARGLCRLDLLEQVRSRADLLEHLPRPRRYDGGPLPSAEDRKILEDYEVSLRGLAPLYQAQCLRRACGFLRFLRLRDRVSPDEELFLEWLQEALQRRAVTSVTTEIPTIEKFCDYLVSTEACSFNPVTRWRLRHGTLTEVLSALKAGRRPRLRNLEPHRFLDAHVNEFVRHKRTLGRTFKTNPWVLTRFSRYLRDRSMTAPEEITTEILLHFAGTVLSHQKTSLRKECFEELRRFFRFLVRRRVFKDETDPARALPKLRRPSRPPTLLLLREIAAILEELRHHSRRRPFDGLMYFTLVHLIYACGLRRREPVRLRVEDVDLDRGTLFIRNTKFGKDRLIPIGTRTAQHLADFHREREERLGCPDPGDPFFVRSTGEPAQASSLGWAFRRATRRAGVRTGGRRPRLHDLRHSFAVHRLHKWHLEGADPQQKLVFLSIYMGHVSVESTQHYLHLTQDLLRVAGRPLEKTLEEVGRADEP